MLDVDKRTRTTSVSCSAKTGCPGTYLARTDRVDDVAKELQAIGWQLRARANRTTPDRADWTCPTCAVPGEAYARFKHSTAGHMPPLTR